MTQGLRYQKIQSQKSKAIICPCSKPSFGFRSTSLEPKALGSRYASLPPTVMEPSTTTRSLMNSYRGRLFPSDNANAPRAKSKEFLDGGKKTQQTTPGRSQEL